MKSKLPIALFVLFLSGTLGYIAYTGFNPMGEQFEASYSVPNEFTENIQPIFEGKCIACHSCYNSPCQLDLTSYHGLIRGASTVNMYDFPKVEPRQPTRLFVDAHSEKEWRELGFFSVTEGGASSLLLKMISGLPGIESGLQEKYDSEYSRTCVESSSEKDIARFKENNPAGRMPLGLPGLSPSEVSTINQWVAGGAEGPTLEKQEALILKHPRIEPLVKTWENFLNNTGMKNQIVSRYLYEHLFLAHIYFEDYPDLYFNTCKV